ncbi:oligopeptide-binding protein OppA [Reticulibacter mediterranei]|uniref:Oligopeptide-binding protein OppA n=1 Tax=Reticulibacter mediterranei TaxID=2778369 RepID=A0A8J3ISR3_9CHLR|nr:peptide ABC transporter substrate-binding protein [Reticulibacter mediterranei]GHO97204.1 oligopeptide-binding protein OppA [Reticulibacter mediterranei]
MQSQSLTWSGKAIGLLVLSLMMLIVSACGGGSQQQSSQQTTKASDDKQIYVWPIEGRNELQAFDPALVTDLPSISAVNLVFTGLVSLDDKLQVRDQLAQSHQVASDGVTWTFKLKPNLKFSDGKALTSADVAYSIDRALKPELKSTTSPLYLGLIKDADKRQAGKISSLINDSILTPDPQTVVLIANQKAAYFLQILTYQSSYVVEKSMIDKYGDNFVDHLSEGIGGAGPFKVSKYIRGKDIEFVPNENYYGAKSQLKKIIMPFYQREDTSYRAYQADQIDMASVQAAQVEQAKALPNGQLHQVPLLDVFYFTMNYLAKPFDNIKIRQAFALAIDKDAIAQNVYKGNVLPTNHIIPEGMVGYNPDLKGPDGTTNTKGDQAKAKQLLAEGMKEAGYTQQNFPGVTLTYSSQGSSDLRNELSAVQQMWQSTLGINVKLDDIDFNKLLEERHNSLNTANGMQMYALYWVSDYPDPQDWLTLIFDKGSSKNAMNYGQNHSSRSAQQQAVQKLMEEADVTSDQTKRVQMYNQAEQELINDVVWIPRYQYKSTFVRKPCVVGIVDNAQQTYSPDIWGNVYISSATPCANTQQYS